MASPNVYRRTYAVPRSDGGAGDYEDAAAASTDAWPVCAAVADGATESAFARQWAAMLAQGLVDTTATTREAFGDRLPDWRDAWAGVVDGGEEERPWYVTAKAAEGAHATILGVSVHSDGTWRALSVGDCCLFHVREKAVRETWPMDEPEAFDHRPSLVASRGDASAPTPDVIDGLWKPGDAFLLATDALAAWLMRRENEEAGVTAWLDLEQDAFRERITEARDHGDLRNDDATLLVLGIDGSGNDGESGTGSSDAASL